ncbi:MAG: class II aldolase/adducin family protein [Deltaproteobacteria bacterium]|nr:class II aldolase/adducin family protein [Deltaproteobacteria bacterium]
MGTNKQEEVEILRKELTRYSRRSYERGLICGTGGNLSARIPGTDIVLVTPTGVSLGDVEPQANILVNLEGEVLDSPLGLVPSKETSFHLRAYRLRPEISAVAHLHPPYATAYANKGVPLPLVTVSARANLKHVPTIECALPGSEELCELVTKGLEDYPEARAVLMKEHGILTLGKDLKTAFYLADLVEDTAKIAFIEANIKL